MEIARVQALSQRVVQTYAWGEVVWHVWGAAPNRASSANPLVLLHGGSGSWTHWLRNVTHWAQNRDVWALDIPGFGDSSLPPQVADADGLVPYMAELLENTFQHRSLDVIGFSFGGMTAGLVAAQFPALFRRLILVGAPGLGLFGKVLPMRGMLPNMDELAQRQVHRHNLRSMMLAHSESITEETINLQQANVARDRLRRRRIARTDVLSRVQTLWQCPVHGVWGELDALYSDTLHEIPKVLPGLDSFTVVPDAGHWLMYERPVAFHHAIDAILNTRQSNHAL